MSVIGLHGIPGSGKTLSATAIVLKYYKKQNRLHKQFFRYIRKKDIIINNIYTNYPVLLNKRKKLYTNVVTIDDLNNTYSFLPKSLIVLDEVQAFYDSYRDFKNFPPAISSFLQFHRHFGVKDIYILSQHPRRLVTYIRDVICEYHRIKKFLKIPILNLGIVCYRKCFEFEDFTESFTRDKEIKKKLEIKTRFYCFKLKKVYKSYISTYLKALNENKPLCNLGTYKDLSISTEMRSYLENKLFK